MYRLALVILRRRDRGQRRQPSVRLQRRPPRLGHQRHQSRVRWSLLRRGVESHDAVGHGAVRQ